MKLLVFGASGKTGNQILQQALDQGHNVSAFVRDTSTLTIKHPKLTLLTGDVLNPDSVHKAIPGHDAVLCTIGSPANKIGVIRSQGTKNIINAMEDAGIKRLVCQTSLGYGDSIKTLDSTPWYFKYLIVPYILKKGFADHALQESYIKNSSLDWIIARPGNLTDGPKTGNYSHGFSYDTKGLKIMISRADVAHFMIDQLNKDQYLKKTVGLSY